MVFVSPRMVGRNFVNKINKKVENKTRVGK